MTLDDRAHSLAQLATGLALGAEVTLPDSLLLWSLAGGRPTADAIPSADPGGALGEAMERSLADAERRQGAHYTPSALADRVADLAVAAAVGPVPVVDPACGAGALLLAAARRLAGAGRPRAEVARDLLWGADVTPLAVAVTEAAIALWSGGIAPAPGHLVVADTLVSGPDAWPDRPRAGFGAVVGNPPFQNQLATTTARPTALQRALRGRYGAAVTPYVDTAALFLLAALDLAAPGARVAMVQPQSTVASRDAGGVRAMLAERSRLVALWSPDPGEQPFAARVQVCVPVLEAGAADPDADWIGRLATARGLPAVELDGTAQVGALATAVAGFRQHYYALVDHVQEGPADAAARLITSGLVDVGAVAWGSRPARFHRRMWHEPVVDVEGVAASGQLRDGWLERVLRPKVVVASQTRVVEAAADRTGAWVPVTPIVSVVPNDPGSVDLLAAALCAPPVAAWAAHRASGTGMSAASMRISAGLVLAAPLPSDRRRWAQAATELAAGDLEAYAELATAMHALPSARHDEVVAWWHAARPGTGR